ncbi:uncharacterized protein LOC127711642 [Mytilus californianus]|uniref:uncharacterized protein LOC127711642 n=1 Tax=Mytilus californianus TaxID=6549 RepID=UPI0022458567|nr:uncharacterized protein LOC127711642 [Mytilus californianus]
MENFVRMFMLLKEVAVGVIRAFLEDNIIPVSFEIFLQRHIHDLYHLCYTRRCCSCGLSKTFPTKAVIIKAQLDILFVQQPGVNCSSNSRFCCCSYIATPNIQLDTIDITLCIAIIKNFITLNQQQNDCLTEIRNVRNEISHLAHEHDIDSTEFYRMWGKVTNASIHLAAYTNHTYSADIQDKIERLRTRPILAVEYTESLREIVKWMKENDENRVEMEERLKRIETKIDEINMTFKFQQTSNKHECELPYTTETQPKIVEVNESDNVIGEDDAKYFKLISDVHQLRQSGDKDTNDGMIYSVLVYIVLHGSATEEDVDYEVLTNIYNSIYKTIIPSETVSIESCLAELVPKYLDQVDEKFTPCSINIVKAVIYTFGNESCECFVQNCSLDVMMDYVVPSGASTDDFHVVVDICVLASALVQRMKSNSDAKSVGKYIYKSFVVHENVEISNLFIDTLEQSNEDFT